MKRKILIGITVFVILVAGFIAGNIFNPSRLLSATGMIQTPINTSVANTTWTAITLGTAQRCQSFVAKSRGGDDWKMSDSSAGTKYITIGGASSISMDIGAQEGETLFYVQSATGAETIETLITR